MLNNNTCVFPGSFDPVTNGHIDIIKRACKIYDKVFVLVANNSAKSSLFTLSERKEFIEKSLSKIVDNFEVAFTDGLTIDFCTENNVNVILRSLRNGDDYINEVTMGLINRKLSGIETVFLIADTNEQHISSSAVKDLAVHSKDLLSFVPKIVAEALINKYSNE